MGLSLTEFVFSSAIPRPGFLQTVAGSVTRMEVSVTVQNTGLLVGDEVVMAYFNPVNVSLKVYPVKSLFDFSRVSDLQPNATEVVRFRFNAPSPTLTSTLTLTPTLTLTRPPSPNL